MESALLEVSKTRGNAKQGKRRGKHRKQAALKEKDSQVSSVQARNLSTGTMHLLAVLPITSVGFKKILSLNYVYMGNRNVQVSAGTCRGHKGALDPLDLWQLVVSNPVEEPNLGSRCF